VSPDDKLDIAATLRGAVLVPWGRRGAFARALAFPAAAIVVVQVAFWHFSVEESTWATWLAWGVRSALWILFAVICHRLVLLDAREPDSAVVPPWTWRETRFLGWFIATCALAIAVAWVSTLVLGTVFGNAIRWLTGSETMFFFAMSQYVGMVLAAYAFARIAFVFPATAIDARAGLQASWRQTRGNGLRMMVIVGALPWIVRYATWSLYSDEPGLPEVVFVLAVGTVLLVIEVAALSLAYRQLAAAPRE